jgi:hypothetical protein
LNLKLVLPPTKSPGANLILTCCHADVVAKASVQDPPVLNQSLYGYWLVSEALKEIRPFPVTSDLT